MTGITVKNREIVSIQITKSVRYLLRKELIMLVKTLHRLFKDESGATAIEYGLIAALVSVAAIGALTAMGGSLDTMFQAVSTALDTATGGGV